MLERTSASCAGDGGPRWRAAIVGAGRIAGSLISTEDRSRPPRTHAHAMAACGFTLDTVVDPAIGPRRDFAALWQVPQALAGMDELIAAGPFDLVAICSPGHAHASQAITLLRHQVARLLVVEKPVCLQPEELEQLNQAAHGSATRIVINHSRRFDAGHRAVRDLVSGGTLGRPTAVRGVYYGGWMLNGCHLVDTLSMVLGGPLTCVGARRGAPGRNAADPCLDGSFACSNHPGVPIAVESVDETCFQLFEIEIRLTAGRIRLLDFGAQILVERVETNSAGERELVAIPPPSYDAAATAMKTLYAECSLWLSGDSSPNLDQADLHVAAATMAVLFNARQKASIGQED